jgi:6,7-dimethyl-8-ribityllumazine synthase (EC 2.5.1.9)
MEFKFDRDANQDFLVNAKVAIIVGYFYQDIGDKLLAAAHETLVKYGINKNNVNVFYAPGAFEIPLLAKRLAAQKSAGENLYDGIVTLGAVINGENPHTLILSVMSVLVVLLMYLTSTKFLLLLVY